MNKKEFVSKLTSELINLKNNATIEEIEMLDKSTFNSSLTKECIYGQMTGNCNSDRAKELCPKVFSVFDIESDLLDNVSPGSFYTPLEVYLLFLNKEKDKFMIIDYLRGEIPLEKLELTRKIN